MRRHYPPPPPGKLPPLLRCHFFCYGGCYHKHSPAPVSVGQAPPWRRSPSSFRSGDGFCRVRCCLILVALGALNSGAATVCFVRLLRFGYPTPWLRLLYSYCSLSHRHCFYKHRINANTALICESLRARPRRWCHLDELAWQSRTVGERHVHEEDVMRG